MLFTVWPAKIGGKNFLDSRNLMYYCRRNLTGQFLPLPQDFISLKNSTPISFNQKFTFQFFSFNVFVFDKEMINH